MTEYADFFPQLALGAALLLAALGAVPLFGRIRMPAPAAFLAVGIAGGLLGIAPTSDLSPATLQQIGAVALFAILFQGGLATGWTAWRRVARPILALGIVGTAATAIALAVVARFIVGLEWSVAVLVGVALSPTDPAAVYAVLRGREGVRRARTILEGESGFNDPAAISLMVAVTATVVTNDASSGHALLTFCLELAIGSALGIGGGLLLLQGLRVAHHLAAEVRAVAVVLAVVLLGAVAATAHGSGFLAVYIAGLVLSETWALQGRRAEAVPEAMSAGAEPLLFATLGAAFAPLVGGGDIAAGAVLTLVTVFAVRPLVASACLVGSRLPTSDRALVSWGALKGAVPLLLAAYPALEGFEQSDAVSAIVLVATAVSLAIQGATLPLVADAAQRRSSTGSAQRNAPSR
jgi:cell volume regulation protein A